MRRVSPLTQVAAVILAAGLTAGCSTIKRVFPDHKADYKQAQSVPSLDVPPDLSSTGIADSLDVPADNGTATYSQYTSEQKTETAASGSGGVLPKHPGVTLVRDGQMQWLEVDAPADQVWNKLREFWLQNGFLLKQENPTTGVMVTDWAEYRPDVAQGSIRRFLSKALNSVYSQAGRNQYRVWLEHGSTPGTTEVFLSQRGMVEVVQGTPDAQTGTMWVSQPSDPGLEADMLRRIMVYLGVSEAKAKAMAAQPAVPAAKAALVKGADGAMALMDKEGFDLAWRRTGIALDRVGMTVQDRDRSKGIYYVQYGPADEAGKKRGFWSHLAFWRRAKPASSDRYQISLQAADADTRIVVLDKDGKRDDTDAGRHILNLLLEQLR